MRPYTQMQVGFAPRLAAFYAGLFITGGIQLPFFPVWLKTKGLDPQMIGLALAAPIVARMIAVPLVARPTDAMSCARPSSGRVFWGSPALCWSAWPRGRGRS
jgi:PPP family 3-phenylpropionic acid transporter